MRLFTAVLSPIYSTFFSVLLFIVCAFFILGCQKDLQENITAGADKTTGSLRPKPRKQMNIVYIMSDDVGYEIPTYNGGSSYNTPNLDFMAANGVQFPNFYAHPDGSPSRLAAMTGKYSYQNYTAWGYLPPDQKTFANTAHDAGYATCFVGKWQMDNGDFAIKNGGFDKYRVFLPFQPVGSSDTDQYYRRYKTPLLYENGSYLPDDFVKDKYSEDLFYDYASSFIDSNVNKPFLLFYSCNLVQRPWSPTPDDPDYASWNPTVDDQYRANTKYFPGMVAYMDKIIGKLITKVQQDGLADNTIFIFTSDNATNRQITSVYKGQTVSGAKNYTYRAGINVPLVCYGSNALLKGKTDTALVDMTDFLPTVASMANVSASQLSSYGTLDGFSFYGNLTGGKKSSRDYVFCHWEDFFYKTTNRPPLQRYAFDYNYKLYDSTAPSGHFYNIVKDPTELHPIANRNLTKTEKQEKAYLQGILDSHK